MKSPLSSWSGGQSISTGVLRLSCLGLTCLLLSACGHTAVLKQVETKKMLPPVALLECSNAPAVPPKPRTQQQVGVYIAQLEAAFQDCKKTVEETKRWADQGEKQ